MPLSPMARCIRSGYEKMPVSKATPTSLYELIDSIQKANIKARGERMKPPLENYCGVSRMLIAIYALTIAK